jgi:hypothetical protein
MIQMIQLFVLLLSDFSSSLPQPSEEMEIQLLQLL